MKTLIISLLWAIFFFPNVLFAQNLDYEPGYIIENNVTISGLIKRSDELSMSKSIQFKTTNNEVKEYFPGQITSFGFTNNPADFQMVPVYLPSSIDSLKRFARVLAKGTAELFKLQISNKELPYIYMTNNTSVYILKKEGQFYTLGQFESEGGGYYKLDKKYIGLLRALLFDCKELQKFSFDNLKFNDKSIIDLIYKYNQCINPGSYSKVFSHKTTTIIKTGLEIYFGVISHPKDDGLIYSTSQAAGYFWEIRKPDLKWRSSLKVGINYLYHRITGDNTTRFWKRVYPYYYVNTQKDQFHYLRLPLNYQYNFSGPISARYPFLTLGITPAFSSNQNFNYLNLMQFISLGGGTTINKLKIGVLMELTGVSLNTEKFLNINIGYILKNKITRE